MIKSKKFDFLLFFLYNYLYKERKKGDIMSIVLDETQKEIVETTSDRVLVVAGSGSGKTRVVTERIKFLLDNNVNPKGIVAITFTNAAAEEMRERLGEKAKDAYIGTIHSYANKLLIKNGISTAKAIKEEDFDGFFELIEDNPQVLEPVEYLFVDEFQDINTAQYIFLMDMINADNFFAVGDDYQSIYQWRGSKPKYFFNLAKDPNCTVYFMSNNYRTGYNIVDFALGFLEPVKNKIPKNVKCLNPNHGKVIERKSLDLNYLYLAIQKDKEYGKWFIITRANSQIDEVMRFLNRNKIPCDTFKKGDLSSEQLQRKLKENTVKVLTAHSAKGLENDYVAVIGISPYSDAERRLAYVAATRAKTLLIWHYSIKGKRRKYMNNWE